MLPPSEKHGLDVREEGGLASLSESSEGPFVKDSRKKLVVSKLLLMELD